MAYPKAIAHYPKSMQVVIKTIYNRIESGKNALIPVVGGTGSGKSLSTLSLMIGLYLYRNGEMPPVEYIIQRTIFRAGDLLRGLNANDGKNLTRGDAWDWDEAGIDAGHKSHASIKNRVVGFLAQTFRNLQQVVFFTVPTISFIDASVRKLFHFYLETQFIDKNEKLCVIKPLLLQYNTRMDKTYYHKITYPSESGGYEEIELMGVPLPPKEYVDAYEKKKNAFTKDLNLQIQAQLSKLEEPLASEKKSEEGKNEAVCVKCNYKWATKSILKYVVCPSCRNRSPNPAAPQFNLLGVVKNN